MEEEGGMETEIIKRVGAGWSNRKKCNGLLFDTRMPAKLRLFKTVIRLVFLYRAEPCAATKRQAKWNEVNEMRMLCWIECAE